MNVITPMGVPRPHTPRAFCVMAQAVAYPHACIQSQGYVAGRHEFSSQESGRPEVCVGAEERTADEPDPVVNRFLEAVWMERGLSPNTLAAYRADLTALNRWLERKDIPIIKTRSATICWGSSPGAWKAGARPRSTARQLSSFRRFFRYLAREGMIREDPTAQIAMPKIGRSLPKSLTEDEVESLLMAPAVTDPLGHRDRTMLEVLYATGLRVSELVNLKHNQVNLNQGVLRIVGKGNRERLIPLGEEAVRWLQQFVQGPRAEILLERQTDFMFPTRRGDKMTRQAFWHIIKRYATQGWRAEGTVTTHAASRVRDAPAEPRCGPARRADVARSQRPFHHADLYPRRPRAHERAAYAASPARLSLLAHRRRALNLFLGPAVC